MRGVSRSGESERHCTPVSCSDSDVSVESYIISIAVCFSTAGLSLKALSAIGTLISSFVSTAGQTERMMTYAAGGAWMVVLFHALCSVRGQPPCSLTDVPLQEGFDIDKVRVHGKFCVCVCVCVSVVRY